MVLSSIWWKAKLETHGSHTKATIKKDKQVVCAVKIKQKFRCQHFNY